MARNREVSLTVDVDLSELDDDDVRSEYEVRFVAGAGRPVHEADLREDALRALRAGRLDDCLHHLSKVLGRDFINLPDALDRYTKETRRAA